eukprot:570792_1
MTENTTNDTEQKQNTSALQDCFDELVANAASLYLDTQIPVLPKPPTSLEFYRDYVSFNRPCIIQHGFDHWPASYLWSNAYLRKKMNDAIVTVAATPNGFADAVYNHKYFVLPQQRLMKFTDFVDHLELWHDHDPQECQSTAHTCNSYRICQTQDENATEKKIDYIQSLDDEIKSNTDDDETHCALCNEILYCQLQNGCMADEYSLLCEDIEMDIEWVSTALNKKPDAINFWMGENRSISSMHQDPYENIYCVLAGEKKFILYPPTDEIYLKKTPFQKAIYSFNDKVWSVEYHPKWEYVAWIDILHGRNVDKCNKMEVIVRKGEMLYLPGLYFHEVRQNVDEFGRVLAVNFWYDMNYDIRWNLLNFMKSTIKACDTLRTQNETNLHISSESLQEVNDV